MAVLFGLCERNNGMVDSILGASRVKGAPSARNPLPMLVVLYGGAFVAAFNENIVNVALISIMGEFSVSAATAQWLVTGYMIVTCIVVASTAFLSRRFNLRTLFFAALLLMVLGSVVCATSQSFLLLLVFRLVQALGTGLLIPAMMNAVLVLAPRKKLGTYLSIGSCMITFGPAFAPVVSGLMVTAIGWRFVFVPPAVAAVLLAVAGAFFVGNLSEPEQAALDVVSVLLSAAGLALFVYGLSIVADSPFVALAAMALGVACIVLFAIRQGRVENPLLNLEPLRNRLFFPVCLLMIVAMMTSFSMSVLLPLYFEGSLGMTSLVSGAMLLVPILANALTSVVGGRFIDRFGCWPLLPLGFGIVAVGQIAVCLVAPQMSAALILASSVIVYAGVGLVFSPSQTAGLQTLSPEQNADGVALVNVFVQLAAAFGPSLFVGVFSSVTASELAAGASSQVSQAMGFAQAVFIAAVVAAVGFGISFAYARVRHGRRAQEGVFVEVAGAGTSLSVASIMKEPYTVSDRATVRDAMMALVERGTSGLPIVDGQGVMVGFVTDGDVLKVLGRQDAPVDLGAPFALYRDTLSFAARLVEALSANVMDIATKTVISVGVRTPIDDVCALLSARRIKKVPVLEEGRVVGTISRSDIVRRLMVSVAQGCESGATAGVVAVE